jgi:hypothetical protein
MSIASIVLTGDSVMVALDRIPVDEKAQTRVKVRAGVVREYAAAMKAQRAEGELRFPPVILFTDGSEYWLGDGFHRVLAARKAGLTEIAAEVRPGTQRDAILCGIGANGGHGLPRTNADKRKAIALVLADPEWSQWSDREIARRCQVGYMTIGRMRRGLSAPMGQMGGRKVQRGSSVYEMNLSAKNAAGEALTTETSTAKSVMEVTNDALGIPVPESRREVFAALAQFQQAQESFDRLAELLEWIAQGPGGAVYKLEMVRTTNNNGQPGLACRPVRAERTRLVAAQPYCGYCPNCHGRGPSRLEPVCKKCGGRGWTTRQAFESCALSDRQRILAMRPSEPK